MEKKTRKPKVDYGEEFIQDAVNLVYSTSKLEAQITRESKYLLWNSHPLVK